MASEPDKTFTRAERIHQLCAIDTEIALLPQHIGLALKALTNPSEDPAVARATFQEQIQKYFNTLSNVDVQLRRQVYALQEAGLIKEGNAKDARDATTKDLRTGGGESSLDTSWLNSRAKDTVGKGMEAELWERARRLADKVAQGQEAQGAKDDSEMEVEEDVKREGEGAGSSNG